MKSEMIHEFNLSQRRVVRGGTEKPNIQRFSSPIVGPGIDVGSQVRDYTDRIPRFTGTIYYVDASRSDDSGTGLQPETAKKTIGAAIALASAGDAVTVKAGTYAEAVNLNLNSLELWPEIGTIIAPASGTPLTVSGHYCKVICPYGALRCNPVAAGTGVLVSGNWGYINNVRVPCNSSADIGFDVTGDGCVLYDCRCSSPLTAAFKLQGDKLKLMSCCTGGEVADTSIGFWVTNNCDKIRIKDCGSQGHSVSGFQIDSGCTNGAIDQCYSGRGDGRWSDNDHSAVWSDFHYDDVIDKSVEFDGSGPASVNLFKLTGSVLIDAFYGNVEEALSADIGTGYIDLYDGTNTVDITDAPGPSLNSLGVGSHLHKIDDATIALEIEDASQCRMYEDASKFGQDPNFQLTAKAGATTYVRFVYSGAGTSGEIDWYCKWKPLSEDGFLEAA